MGEKIIVLVVMYVVGALLIYFNGRLADYRFDKKSKAKEILRMIASYTSGIVGATLLTAATFTFIIALAMGLLTLVTKYYYYFFG